jgi:hypothetical protein
MEICSVNFKLEIHILIHLVIYIKFLLNDQNNRSVTHAKYLIYFDILSFTYFQYNEVLFKSF